ncbi:MAG: NAD(+)/NADH kinase [Elusimicrobiota bacterium]
MSDLKKASSFRTVILFCNERKPAAVRAAVEVRRLLRERGVSVRVAPKAVGDVGVRSLRSPIRIAKSSFDLAVVIGGDGTMLRAARVLAGCSVPLLGINTGGLGFLNAVDLPGFRRGLGRILNGGFRMQSRGLLSVEVRRAGRRIFGPHAALNECVVRSGDQVRAVVLRVWEAGRYVADYFGDGLIVATPTGSTAYALAAGGPVVHPSLPAVILAPICPHTLAQRPLVLSADDALVLRLERKSPQDRPKAVVSVDGQIEQVLHVEDEVIVSPHPEPLTVLFDPRRSHFEVLRAKLRWGER